ncbi:MAG TPA: hypothetical protein VMG59_07395 [Phycisphaerae bacterium]|nr:hypothetical protein [Phycisphaerae bacterium]
MAKFENYIPAVVQALQQRGIKGECPSCKKSMWVVHELPLSVPVYEKSGDIKFPGTSMPMAALLCRQCGWTGLYSLGVLGLIGPEQTGQMVQQVQQEEPARPSETKGRGKNKSGDSKKEKDKE